MESMPEGDPTWTDPPTWTFTGIGSGERELAPPSPPHITEGGEEDALPVVDLPMDESSAEAAVPGIVGSVGDADVDQGNNHQGVAGSQAQDQVPAAEDASPCKICFTNLTPEQFIYINCGCLYCVECLNAHFRSGLANRASYPPRCCGPQAIDIAVVQGFLDDDNVIRYHSVHEEFDAVLPLYCARKDCGTTFIGDAAPINLQGHEKMVFCPECALETCARCRELHDAHIDNEGVLECPDSLTLANVKEMAEEENWRRCPGCRHLVEKIDGCDHMTCDCKTEFHYRCGEQYSNDGRCGCAQNPGWDDNEDQGGQDAGPGGQEAGPGGQEAGPGGQDAGPDGTLPDQVNVEHQLPENIQNDLHLSNDFPFSLENEHGQTPAGVIQVVIDDMQDLLDSGHEEAQDEVTADGDQVMQDAGDVDAVEPVVIGSEATDIVEAAEAHHRVEGVAEHDPEVQVQGLQPDNQGQEEGEGEESDNLDAVTGTAGVALAYFRKASAELQTAASALVRIRRRRAERALAAAQGVAPFVPPGNRGGRGRGRGLVGRALGRGGRRRTEGLGNQVIGA